jgi:hypothetical protein
MGCSPSNHGNCAIIP